MITRKDIRVRFFQNLEWATKIDLATAWTTPNQSLCTLQRRSPSLKVRAVVGPLDGTTDPDALRALHCMGKLRMHVGKQRFHPKVYVFRGTDTSVAWIGSANFTCSGFGENEEVLFETSDTKTVEGWFQNLWEERCAPLNESTINRYANWRESLTHRSPQEIWPPATINVTRVHRMQLLEEVNDWRSYVAALEKCDLWWSWESHRTTTNPFSVLGEKLSYLHTIGAGRKLAQLPNWRNLKQCECYILRGDARKEGNWALLGSCRGTVVSVFNAKKENIPEIREKRDRIHR